MDAQGAMEAMVAMHAIGPMAKRHTPVSVFIEPIAFIAPIASISPFTIYHLPFTNRNHLTTSEGGK